jgi:hypothetical protein
MHLWRTKKDNEKKAREKVAQNEQRLKALQHGLHVSVVTF